jgi:Transposase IS4
LIRAFGRMKFKVRIVSKAARYGIKIYVVTDAETAFVLKVIIYTGKTTYNADDADGKKTVQICCKLIENYVGSHRTIYVDRFYTSVDLMKALRERDIYVTGTVMSNRIPKGVRIAKNSAEFKAMNRGDKKIFRLKMFHTDGKEYDGQNCSYGGLVCWRDRNMVYSVQ